MSRNPYQVTKEFESALCEYTGAPFAVAVNSCTMALTLAVAWHLWAKGQEKYESEAAHKWGTEWSDRQEVEIPARTYISVPMAIIHAGGHPVFRDEDWLGMYQLAPLPVFDSARWFSSGMYLSDFLFDGRGERRIGHNYSGKMLCVSFHASKTLGLEQGGAILHDDPEADAWFRRARFDGRTEGVAPADDHFEMVGFHCYLNPSTAAQGILRLHSLSRHNEPLQNDDYPDLSTMEIFK